MRSIQQVLVFSLCLAACPEGGTVICTGEAAASVDLIVLDEADAVVSGATATWSVDGGAAQACEEARADWLVCGWDVRGEITVRAEAEGYQPAETTVTVTGDECHVESESVILVLVKGG